MHIQSYLNEFNSIPSKQRKKLQHMFSNLDRSRRSLTKLYQQDNPPESPDTPTPIPRSRTPKTDDYDFDDNLFNSLYKSSLRMSHLQKNNTITNHNPDVKKMSFKLNYVEDSRPATKRNIISNVDNGTKREQSFNANFFTQPKTAVKVETTKRSNIEKFIISRNSKDPQRPLQFIRSRKPISSKTSIMKEILDKIHNPMTTSNNPNKATFQSRISNSQHQTLPVRKSQSSSNNYTITQLPVSRKKCSPVNRYHYSSEKQRETTKAELPDYAKNIMKPCKIQGIELVTRPLTVGMRRNRKGSGEVGRRTLGLRRDEGRQSPNSKHDPDLHDSTPLQFSTRTTTKTAHHSTRPPSTNYNNSYRKIAQQFLKKKQLLSDRKPLQLEPWHNEDVENQEECEGEVFGLVIQKGVLR